MGRSITVHCLGYGEMIEGKRPLFLAMTKTEIAQEVEKAKREGLNIEFWEGQTSRGRSMLGGRNTEETGNLILPRLYPCPICTTGCPVCNFSGICRKGHEKHWRTWQIEEMKRRR